MNWGPNTFEKNVSLDIFYKIFINISKIKFDIYKEKIGDLLKNPPPPLTIPRMLSRIKFTFKIIAG